MEIEEIRKAKQEMERQLAIAINEIMDVFEMKTGYLPSRICVELLQVTQEKYNYARYLQGKRPHMLLGTAIRGTIVKTEVDIMKWGDNIPKYCLGKVETKVDLL